MALLCVQWYHVPAPLVVLLHLDLELVAHRLEFPSALHRGKARLKWEWKLVNGHMTVKWNTLPEMLWRCAKTSPDRLRMVMSLEDALVLGSFFVLRPF